MKFAKIIISAFALAAAVFSATPARAVKVCRAAANCSSSSFNDTARTWTVTCESGVIGGEAYVSEAAGYNDFSAPYDASKRNCYCRLTSPAVGGWVLIDAGLHDGVGSDICAESCTGTIEGNAVARSAVLGAMP